MKWYFSLFEEVINRPQIRLLIVGYGFGDRHINQCIVNAIGKGLKIHIISPQSPQDFRDQLKMWGRFDSYKPLGKELWNGLVQYWPATLTDFYYDNVSPPGDLNHRGRALFRSMGLP